MTAFWICRDGDTVIAGSVARYTQPEDLAEWRLSGRNPELVDVPSGFLPVPAPLPRDARLIDEP